jgi:polysaccharide pyruvyl transferase WcaK-like protein
MKRDKYKDLPVLHFAETIKKNHNKKRMKAIIFGNFGARNFGDEAILAGELNELKKIANLKITVVARFPEEVRKMHGVSAISPYLFHDIMREIKRSDFVIVGGGGLINKVERGMVGFLFQLYIIFLFLLFPRLQKKKVYVLGVGIYNNSHPIILQLALPLLRRVTVITVRDLHSYEFLKSKKVMVRLFKDNSFLMSLVPIRKVLQDTYFKRWYSKNRINIGISLIKPDNKKEEKHLVAELVSFISKNHAVADFWFYSSDCNPSYFNDEKFGHLLHEAVREKVGKDIHFFFIPTNWHPQTFFSSLKLMDFVIAMRLHVAIFAYRNDKDFVTISYDKKCASFSTSIGKDFVEINNVTAKYIQKNFAE